jgi:hypothetical protein
MVSVSDYIKAKFCYTDFPFPLNTLVKNITYDEYVKYHHH